MMALSILLKAFYNSHLRSKSGQKAKALDALSFYLQPFAKQIQAKGEGARCAELLFTAICEANPGKRRKRSMR
jgi:hypothetical protein